LGTPTIVAELQKQSEHASAYAWRWEDFRSEPMRDGGERTRLAEAFRFQTRNLSERVIVDDEATRAHFEQIASILSTRESVKAQRRMEWLTVFTAILAVASLLVALLPQPWSNSIQSYLLAHVPW
jgi:hypothetical protein